MEVFSRVKTTNTKTEIVPCTLNSRTEVDPLDAARQLVNQRPSRPAKGAQRGVAALPSVATTVLVEAEERRWNRLGME